MKKINIYLQLAFCILLCEGVGIVSALLSNITLSTWFSTFEKPSWNPPAYLFGPVWTLLYLLMGISLWLVWKSNGDPSIKQNAIAIFFLQLVFNFLWSIIFFRFHSPYYAFIDIVVLLISIVLTIYYFSFISKKAAWLLLPYLLWVCFATVLNFSIWRLNI